MAIALLHAADPSLDRRQVLGQLVRTIQNRSATLASVTARPVYMESAASALCADLSSVNAIAAPHEGRYIKVYISPESKQTLLEGKGVYPVGTLLVKEKCADAEFRKTELFTVMLKREAGYNSAAGDWEFLVLDRDARLTANGKIDSCMECHQRFQRTDYVSRVYLQNATGQ
jgi:hypothetical protein